MRVENLVRVVSFVSMLFIVGFLAFILNDHCGRFHIGTDMNGDLVFSISDVWLLVKFIWLLPAKAVVGLAQSVDVLAAFLEIHCSTGESWGGGVFSLFGWLAVFWVPKNMYV